MTIAVKIKCLTSGVAEIGSGLNTVELRLVSERLTVSELLTRTVTAQIQQLAAARQNNAKLIQLALARHYLTAKDIDALAPSGRIGIFKPPPAPDPFENVDIDEEIQKVFKGFAERAFRIVVDGVQAEALTETITLSEQSKIVFLRLMPLVGG